MKALSLLLLLAALLSPINGFVILPYQQLVYPPQGVSSRESTVALELFDTRKRVKRAYRSLRNRLRRRRNQTDSPQAASSKDRAALAQKEDFFQVTLHENIEFSQALATDIATTQVSFANSVATLEALEGVEETLVLEDIPVTMGSNHAPVNDEIFIGDISTTKSSNGEQPRNGAGNIPIRNGETKSISDDAKVEVVNGGYPKNLYSLPPLDRNSSLTKLETEFRDMLLYFTQFNQADLFTIRDPRLRAIMEGVISGSNEAPVYRAFEVLFEDLPPLRIAGRMIFARLKKVMLQAQSRAQVEVDNIVETSGLSKDTVQASRLAFLTLAIPTEQGHDNKEEHYLTLEQLVESGLAEKARNALGQDTVANFLEAMDPDQKGAGKVTFVELIERFQMIAEATCAVEQCDPAMVLQQVVNEMEPAFGHTPIRQLDTKRQQFSDQYDSMVMSFQEWNDIVPEGTGRRLDVLRGCFVGAANHRVVEALRVVYLDYAALRLAGNSIFALMKALVGQIRKRKTKR